jgi:hypothetical protein
MGSSRPRVRKLTDAQFLQLLRLATGLLPMAGGDLELALGMALQLHAKLIDSIRTQGVRADLGKGDAVIFVPDEGGLAIRLERHRPHPLSEGLLPQDPTEETPTEEADYPDIELFGFEVIESKGEHRTNQHLDAGVDEDTWFE